MLYEGVSLECRKVLIKEDEERTVRSGPTKMRQGQKPARTIATAGFEDEDNSRGEYITYQERGKRSREEVWDHFAAGDWVCGNAGALFLRTPSSARTSDARKSGSWKRLIPSTNVHGGYKASAMALKRDVTRLDPAMF